MIMIIVKNNTKLNFKMYWIKNYNKIKFILNSSLKMKKKSKQII